MTIETKPLTPTQQAPALTEAHPAGVPQPAEAPPPSARQEAGHGPTLAPAPAPDPAAELAARQERIAKRKQELAKKADKGREAMRKLVEEVARRWEFQWLEADIGHDPEKYPDFLDMAADDYRKGRFFLEQISLFYLVSPQLSLTVYELRQAWIKQYGIKTVPEYMLLDQAMLAYFHVIRTNKEIANLFSLIDESLYYPDEPLVRVRQISEKRGFKVEGFYAKEHVMKIQDMLLPIMERFNRMFLRNLRALQELRGGAINISFGQVGQVNLGKQQVNIIREGQEEPKPLGPAAGSGDSEKV